MDSGTGRLALLALGCAFLAGVGMLLAAPGRGEGDPLDREQVGAAPDTSFGLPAGEALDRIEGREAIRTQTFAPTDPEVSGLDGLLTPAEAALVLLDPGPAAGMGGKLGFGLFLERHADPEMADGSAAAGGGRRREFGPVRGVVEVVLDGGLRGSRPTPPERLPFRVPPEGCITVAPDGSFTFEQVAPGTYTLKIRHAVWTGRFMTSAARTLLPEIVIAPQGRTRVELDVSDHLPVPVEGLVLSRGRPHARVLISFRRVTQEEGVEAQARPFTGIPPRTDDRGQFRTELFPGTWEMLLLGRRATSYVRGRFGPPETGHPTGVTFTVVSGEVARVTLRAAIVPTARMRMVDDRGQALKSWRFRLRHEQREVATAPLKSDAAGLVTTGALLPGVHLVQVQGAVDQNARPASELDWLGASSGSLEGPWVTVARVPIMRAEEEPVVVSVRDRHR